MNNRILLITPYSLNYYGGVQNQVLLAKKYLLSKDYQVKIFAHGSYDYQNTKPSLIPFNGSKARVSISYNRTELEKAIDWCDVIHIHEPFIPLIIWNIKTKKKIITTHHATLSKNISVVLTMVYKLLTRDLSIINTCVSKYSYLQANALRKNPKIIPNYIEINNIQKFNNNDSRLTFLGRSEKRKGLNIFLKSIDSYLLNILRPTVVSNKKIKQVFIDSYVDMNNNQKNDILKETSILVASNTRAESFGMVLLEGITNGCVVISSDLNAFFDVLNDSGIYFKNKNHNDLNRMIKETIDMDMQEIWEKQNSHIKLYDVDRVFKMFVELYK
jgi:phosphatidylinositol alpha-mannosyltransferase